MADYSESKNFPAQQYPVRSKEVSNLLKRAEPLINAKKLISRYLKNIPGIDTYNKEELEDFITMAYNEVELDLKTSIEPVQAEEKLPFDKNLYNSFIHVMANKGPIISIERLAVTPVDNSDDLENFYQLPPEWIDLANGHRKQVNVLPLLSYFGSMGQISGTMGNGHLFFLTMLGKMRWIPSFWTLNYTYGLSTKAGQVPVPVNELIGITAAQNILSELSALNVNTSASMSQDGISQSSSNPGPKIYDTRLEFLATKKAKISDQLQSIFSNKYFITNI